MKKIVVGFLVLMSGMFSVTHGRSCFHMTSSYAQNEENIVFWGIPFSSNIEKEVSHSQMGTDTQYSTSVFVVDVLRGDLSVGDTVTLETDSSPFGAIELPAKGVMEIYVVSQKYGNVYQNKSICLASEYQSSFEMRNVLRGSKFSSYRRDPLSFLLVYGAIPLIIFLIWFIVRRIRRK